MHWRIFILQANYPSWWNLVVWKTHKLYWSLAQDKNNHIFFIFFFIVKGETIDVWFFFLKNLRTHSHPQNELCLIPKKHKYIRSVYNREGNGWAGVTTMHIFKTLKCDYGKFTHYTCLCPHVIVACAHVCIDHMSFNLSLPFTS